MGDLGGLAAGARAREGPAVDRPAADNLEFTGLTQNLGQL